MIYWTSEKKGMIIMIHFIVYEKNTIYKNKLKNNILKVIVSKKEKYHIHIFDTYNKELEDLINSTSRKIYLLNDFNLKLTKLIRENDWYSQIILLNHDLEHKNIKKFLILDYLNLEVDDEVIISNLKLALHILNKQKSFKFSYNHEFYQIPFEDILYFEKDLNNNYVTIITKDNKYRIKDSITKLETKLKEFNLFFKTHQSCIVNLKNILKIDFNKNIIYFKTNQTNLLSRNKKKDLKAKLEMEDYHYI